MVGAALICGIAGSLVASAQDAGSSGLSGAVPDCPSKNGTPFMSVRNLIPNTRITKIVALPMNSYVYHPTLQRGVFESAAVQAIKTFGLSVLKRQLTSDEVSSLAGGDGNDPNCGSDLDFSIKAPFYGNLYPNKCSENDYENIYQLTIEIEKNSDRQTHTITMIKNICTETMLDLLPGTPTDDFIQDPKERLSAPTVDDCSSTNGQLSLAVRNLIPDTKVIDIKARSYSNFDFQKHEWDTAYAKEGRRVLNKSFKNEALKGGIDGVDPSATITRVPGSKQGYCGSIVSLARGDDTSTCDADKDNKWNNVFEFAVILQRKDGSKFKVNYTKDACRETVLDITQGTPPNAKL
jgi:hypothetical protein